MELGLSMYFTGKPCVRGQIAGRRVNGKACSCRECMDARATKAAEKYREDPISNIAKVRAYQEKNKDAVALRSKAWAEKNKDRQRANRAAWYAANRERELEKVKASYALRRTEILAAKAEKDRSRRADLNSYQNEYRARDMGKSRHFRAKRIADQIQRTPPWFGELDEFVISEAYHLCELRSVSTGMKWHVDHCIPMQAKEASGLHCWNNIQVIPASINISKRNRMLHTEPFGWMSQA